MWWLAGSDASTLAARKTFAELLDAAAAYARRTECLGDLQHYLTLALGGAEGQGLRNDLLSQWSADTLLRWLLPRRLTEALHRYHASMPLMTGRGGLAIGTVRFWSI
jgi:hypothetical protein